MIDVLISFLSTPYATVVIVLLSGLVAAKVYKDWMAGLLVSGGLSSLVAVFYLLHIALLDAGSVSISG